MLSDVIFINELDLTPVIGDDCNWRVVSDFRCKLLFNDNFEQEIIVTKGFVTDLATIPRPLWWLFPHADGKWSDAACLHDYLYTFGPKLGLTRSDADMAFYRGMLRCGSPKWTARIFWWAVTLFAKSHYAAQ